MKEPTAEKVLEKTFEHLEKVLNEVENHGQEDSALQGPLTRATGDGEKERSTINRRESSVSERE